MSNLQYIYGKRVPNADEVRTPLTHHDVLELVAPFSAADRQVDLEASDRARRRLDFKPLEHPATESMPAVTEHLTLEAPERSGDSFVLERQLRATTPEGELVATLKATGKPVARLLEWVTSVPLARHWREIDGTWLARSYRIRSSSAQSGTPAPQIDAAHARFAQGALMTVEHTLAGSPLEVRLQALDDGAHLLLPDDFLSVAGRAWRPLRKTSHRGWRGSLRVPPKEPDRTREAEAAVDGIVSHVAQTLAAGPGEYHTRHKSARWRAALQRISPALALVAFMIITPSLMFLPTAKNPGFLVIIFQLPTVALIAFFSLRELPVLEIPPRPTPLKQTVWLQPAATPPNK
ncbi:MAG: hypothetical protein AAF184_03890 [Pseudomonadota bacterium]